MEKILRIEEIIFKNNEKDWSTFGGFQIITDQQTIKIGISNSQSCCGHWGYLITNDDFNDFIEAELLNIVLVDTALNIKKVEDTVESLDGGDIMFVNLETSKGIFQIVAYNSHNGYYGHEAVVVSKQLNVSISL